MIQPTAYLYTHWAARTRLCLTDKAVLMILADSLNNGTRKSCVTLTTLCEQTGLGRAALVNALASLKAMSLILLHPGTTSKSAGSYSFPEFDKLAAATDKADAALLTPLLKVYQSKPGAGRARQLARTAERKSSPTVGVSATVIPLFK